MHHCPVFDLLEVVSDEISSVAVEEVDLDVNQLTL